VEGEEWSVELKPLNKGLYVGAAFCRPLNNTGSRMLPLRETRYDEGNATNDYVGDDTLGVPKQNTGRRGRRPPQESGL